jgi:hypothetical protein
MHPNSPLLAESGLDFVAEVLTLLVGNMLFKVSGRQSIYTPRVAQ